MHDLGLDGAADNRCVYVLASKRLCRGTVAVAEFSDVDVSSIHSVVCIWSIVPIEEHLRLSPIFFLVADLQAIRPAEDIVLRLVAFA